MTVLETNRFEQYRRHRAIDHTGKVYNGWRCTSVAYPFGGHMYWHIECESCGTKDVKGIASRKRWPRCGCGRKS